MDICLEVGLPVALEDIGLQGVGRQELEKVAEAACIEGETIHNMPFEVHPGMLVDAMLAADAFGRQRRAVLEGEAHLPAVAHQSLRYAEMDMESIKQESVEAIMKSAGSNRR